MCRVNYNMALRLLQAQVIAVDFDGTLCRSAWPEIGAPNGRLIGMLQSLRRRGVKLILWTCREGEMLDAAVGWCAERNLIFDAVNENLPERIAQYGGDCRKISADLYIDDKALPLEWEGDEIYAEA